MSEDIKMEIETIPIKPKIRTRSDIKLAKFAVCAETGQPVKNVVDATGKEIWLRTDHTVCEKITTLKEFFEKKYNKPFVEEEWKLVIDDINNVIPKDLLKGTIADV